jgi:oxygen-independent coproporphyrinogen-3 oxidase
MDEADKTPGLYIHIPFCIQKCPYCHFYSVQARERIPEYVEALSDEIRGIQEPWGFFDTLYLGGGTPSVLTSEQIALILRKVKTQFDFLPDTEITVEVNPGDVDLRFLQDLRGIGANRLQIGVQSFDSNLLRFLGRRHSPGQAVSSMETARRADFENVGIDLIYGIPGQDPESWRRTLAQAADLSPEHLSCYQLTFEGGTPLDKQFRQGAFPPLGEEREYAFFMMTSEELEKRGYLQYEVSNFAKTNGHRSRHNQKYWNHTPYLGLGPAAHSFRAGRRWWNLSSVERYLARLKAGKRPVEKTEKLTVKQLRLEALFLGLRTPAGISLEDYERQYRFDLLTQKKEILDRYQKDGLLSIQNGRLIPTRAGLAVADRLALI